MKHSLKMWVTAARPWSFPASAVPVAATVAFLFWLGAEINWLHAVWALANIVVFHAAGNTWSDYWDFKCGVDAEDTFGCKNITGGLFAAGGILRMSLVLAAIASAAGLGLMARTGLPLLWIGLGGLCCTLFYPMLKYRALGDVAVLLAYAVLPAAGTAYAVTGSIDPRVLTVALPVGLVTVAILHTNNVRDMRTDARAGILTLPMLLGGRASVGLYLFEILFPFVWIAGMCLTGRFPYVTGIVLCALVPAAAAVRTMCRFLPEGEEAIASLDEMTARLQLLFGGGLALLFFTAGWMGSNA